MADRVLFIGWGTPVRGREERGLEVFNESIGLYGRMQQDGRIEKFDVVLLGPSGDLNGYIELHGSAKQLAAVHEERKFKRPTFEQRRLLAVLRLSEALRTTGLGGRMGSYRQSLTG